MVRVEKYVGSVSLVIFGWGCFRRLNVCSFCQSKRKSSSNSEDLRNEEALELAPFSVVLNGVDAYNTLSPMLSLHVHRLSSISNIVSARDLTANGLDVCEDLLHQGSG